MPIIPLYLLDPVDSNDAILLSDFNFCNPFDDVLPFSTGTVSVLDRQHLWGLSIRIAADIPAVAIPQDETGVEQTLGKFTFITTDSVLLQAQTMGRFTDIDTTGKFKP